MGTQQDFLDDVFANRFVHVNLQRDFRLVPDEFPLGKDLMVPIESNLPNMLLRCVDHTIVTIRPEDVDGLQFNWPVNDSEGYILQLSDGRRVVLAPEKAKVSIPDKLDKFEIAFQLQYNSFKQFIMALKLNMNVVHRTLSQGAYEFDSPLWVRRT